MQKNQRFKLVVLTSSLTFIVLSTLLFLNAISLGDFALPGQPFFRGVSNQRIILAFIMLATVTLSLLRIALRNLETPLPKPVSTPILSEQTEVQDRVAKKIEMAEESTKGDREEEVAAPKKDDAGLLSETAGELRTSVEVLQEELEEILEEEVPADKEHMQSLYEETDRLKKIIDGMEQLSEAQAIARSLKKEPLRDRTASQRDHRKDARFPSRQGRKLQPGMRSRACHEWRCRVHQPHHREYYGQRGSGDKGFRERDTCRFTDEATSSSSPSRIREPE